MTSSIRLVAFHLQQLRPRQPPTGSVSKDELVEVVIPFRATNTEDGRLQNLQTVLSALEHQSVSRSAYTVTLVEQDDCPRHKALLEPLVDQYLFQQTDAEFSKPGRSMRLLCDSRTTAPSSCSTPTPGSIRCSSTVLDGNWDFRTGGHCCLTQTRSSRTPSPRLGCGRTAPMRVESSATSCYTLPEAWSPCESHSSTRLAASTRRTSAGGGEDRDFVNRLEQHVPVARAPGLMIHLNHERPAMRSSRSQIHEEARAAE